MAEEAKFLIKAEDQASAVFQQVGDNADRM